MREADRPEPCDEECLRRFRAGDEAAFDRLTDRHARATVRFASHLLGESHEAEDVAQEAFLRLVVLARRGDFDPRRGRVAPLLFRIVRNLALDRLRARRGGAPLEDASVPLSSDDGVEREERRLAVGAIVATLPACERAALVLREFEGLSYREIAEVLGTTLESVKNWIFRARRRVERAWTEQEERLRCRR